MSDINLGTLEHSLAYLMRRAYRNSQKYVAPVMARYNFKGIELTTLVIIMENPKCNLSDIAQAVAVELPVAHRITKILIEKGFATSQKSKEDKRATLYQTTEIGQEAAEKATAEICGADTPLFKGITDAQMRSMVQSLQIIAGVKPK